MATQTYTQLAPGAPATFGTSGAAVSALQTQLNAQNTGVAGYTPLIVDGKYGPLTQAATQFKAPVPVTAPTTTPTNPVVSSTVAGANVNALGNEIKSYVDNTGLKAANEANTKLIKDQMDSLTLKQEQAIAAIQKQYEEAAKAQGIRQEKDYAGTATNLITAGGGFLGYTGSQGGVLQNLKVTFEAEKQALLAKKDAAIQAAQNAYDDKQFTLAQSLISEAKSYEQELYDRQKDFADEQLALAKESRAQQEFDMGIADKKIEAYTLMSDEEFAKVNPTEIAQLDKVYFPGYTESARNVAKKALEIKTNKDAIALDSDILDMRLKIPLGQKFVLNGQTYTGLKKPDVQSLTVDEKKMALFDKLSTLFSPGYTVPGSDGVPILDNNGYATPEGWKAVIKIAGIDRDDFIKKYGYLIPADYIDEFGLTVPEQELILGKL